MTKKPPASCSSARSAECPHSFIEYEMAPVELKRLLTKAALVQQPSAQ